MFYALSHVPFLLAFIGRAGKQTKNKGNGIRMGGGTVVIKLAKKVAWNQITLCFHAFLSFKKYSGFWFALIGSSFWQAKESSLFFTAFVSLLLVLT